MAFERPMVGEPLKYRGHEIVTRFCGPDLLCYVDGAELGPFYEDTEKARRAGMRHVDHLEKEKEKVA